MCRLRPIVIDVISNNQFYWYFLRCFYPFFSGVFPVYFHLITHQFYRIKPVDMNQVVSSYGVRLTCREQEVWKFAQCGLSSRQIAEKLNIKESTVAHHRTNIIRKKGLLRIKAYLRDNLN